MQNGKIKLKEIHRREVLSTLFLFTLPFLPTLNLFIKETYLPVITFFGLTFDPGENHLGAIFWIIALNIVALSYSFMFLKTAESSLKLSTRFLVFFFTFNLFEYPLSHLTEIKSYSVIVAIAFSAFLVCTIPLFKNIKQNKFDSKGTSSRFKQIGFLVLSLIIITPIYIYRLIPDDRPQYDFGLFTISSSHGFYNVKTFIYVSGFKLGFLSILVFWFITERKWWKYSLFSPILLTIYQMRYIFASEEEFFDEFEFINLLPVFALVILVLLLLSKNAKDQYYFQALYAEAVLNMEKRTVRKYNKRSDRIRKIKEKMEHLKTNHSEVGANELLRLKEELEKQLKHT